MDLNLLYREEMLDHVKNPRNKGVIEKSDYTAKVVNTSCGDELTLYLKLDKNKKVVDVKYEANACAVSVASASMLSEKMIGLPLSEVLKFNEKTVLDNFYSSLTPSRQKCAFLILQAISNLSKTK